MVVELGFAWDSLKHISSPHWRQKPGQHEGLRQSALSVVSLKSFVRAMGLMRYCLASSGLTGG